MFVYSSDSRTVTPGLLHFGIFCDFFANFRKNTPKNTNKTEKIPGLLPFFDIFLYSPGVTTVINNDNLVIFKFRDSKFDFK